MQKLHRLQSIIRNSNLAAVALIPGPNLQYLTGISFHVSERPFIVLVPPEGDPATVLPELEKQQLVDTGFPGKFFGWTDAQGYQDAFAAACQHMKLADKRIGVEGMRMRVREGQLLEQYASGAQIVDADDILVDLRLYKSPEELAAMKQAITISEQALEKLLDELKPGMTEQQVARRLNDLQVEGGGEGASFPTIVLFGARSAMPHGMPGNTTLQEGDVVLIDFGTRYQGYPSDITRTFITGNPSDAFKAAYETVLAANTKGRESARPGISGAELDELTTDVLRDSEFADYIKHRTGHGLGIDIHEHPNISAENSRPLEAGMVFTIEPGLYLEGQFGIRIEDNVVTTADGIESMTTFPRELRIIQL